MNPIPVTSGMPIPAHDVQTIGYNEDGTINYVRYLLGGNFVAAQVFGYNNDGRISNVELTTTDPD